MNRWLLVAFLNFLAVPFSAYAQPATQPHPNFVIIYVDDMGYGDIEPFGSTLNRTPNCTRLAAEGMKLTSFYHCCPVCTPSRTAAVAHGLLCQLPSLPRRDRAGLVDQA